MKKALIIEGGVVAQIEEESFSVAHPYYWVDCDDDMVAHKFKYENGTFVSILEPTPTAEENKQQAQQKLKSSDWTVLSDVNLVNKSEWETYRAALREIARNPQEGNLDWPTKPQNDWS